MEQWLPPHFCLLKHWGLCQWSPASEAAPNDPCLLLFTSWCSLFTMVPWSVWPMEYSRSDPVSLLPRLDCKRHYEFYHHYTLSHSLSLSDPLLEGKPVALSRGHSHGPVLKPTWWGTEFSCQLWVSTEATPPAAEPRVPGDIWFSQETLSQKSPATLPPDHCPSELGERINVSCISG